MELINGVNVFLLLALSSLFSSANAICVPRNSSEFESPIAALTPPTTPPLAPLQTPQQAPPVTVSPSQSPSPPTNSAPAPTASSDEASESEDAETGLQKLHSDLVSSVASSVASTVSSSVTTELVEICDVTSNPELCKSSISSHFEGSTIDPTSALKTEIEQSIKEVEKAIATLNSLSKDTAASHAEIECYDTCLENFDMAIEDLKSGLESIDAHDVGRMESVLTAVLTDLTTCDDTFIEMGVDSPLDSLSTKMNKYASNCLAISKLLL